MISTKLDELIEQRLRLDELIAMLAEIRTCGCEAAGTCQRTTVG